jgi:hypothetical protein
VLNNPLSYVDPTGHFDEYLSMISAVAEVERLTNAIAKEYRTLMKLSLVGLLYVVTPEMRASFRTIDTIIIANEGGTAHFYELNDGTRIMTIGIDKSTDMKDIVLNIGHELRHVWQQDVTPGKTQDSYNSNFRNDRAHNEWDAYKYQGDLDDRLGWHRYWNPWIHAQVYAQHLDLNASYTDYTRWANRYFSFWGPGYRYEDDRMSYDEWWNN